MLMTQSSLKQEFVRPQDSLHNELSRLAFPVDMSILRTTTPHSQEMLDSYRDQALEPLPLGSPMCLDTLSAVDPSVFEDDFFQPLEPTPLSEATCSRLKTSQEEETKIADTTKCRDVNDFDKLFGRQFRPTCRPTRDSTSLR
jgi:hypothetical protein